MKEMKTWGNTWFLSVFLVKSHDLGEKEIVGSDVWMWCQSMSFRFLAWF